MEILKKIVKTIWNLIKICACVCLICATFYYGYNYLNSIFRTPDVDYGDSFHNMPENSVDVIVLGSSHAQYSFAPSFFYQDTGLYSYSLGSSFQPLSVSYQMLREAYKTQSPKLVVLEVYSATVHLDETNEEFDYRYVLSQYQMTGDEKYNTLDLLNNKEKALSYKNEFINNHNNWRTVESIESLLEKDTSIDSYFGFICNWDTYLPAENYWYSTKYENDNDAQLLDIDLQSLNNIYELCKENGTDLLLYATPMDNVTEDMQTLRHKVWNWADEHEVGYIDFLENDEDYDIRAIVHHDGFHTYINGASYITSALAEYVVNNYTFNHQYNESLSNLYKEQIPSLVVGVASKEINMEKLMPRYKDYPATLIVSYRRCSINDKLRSYLDNMGLSDLKENQTYYAVLNNGQIIASSDDYLETEIDNHKIVVSYDGIYFDDELLVNDDTLTIVTFTNDYGEKAVRRVWYQADGLWDKGYNYDYQLNGR